MKSACTACACTLGQARLKAPGSLLDDELEG